SLLTNIAWRQRKIDDGVKWAKAGEDSSRRINQSRLYAEFLAWQTLFAFRQKRKTEAIQLCEKAIAAGARTAVHTNNYYTALATFYEEKRNLQLAIKLRYDQLKESSTLANPNVEWYVRLQRCRLLAKLNMNVDAELFGARQVARKLTKTDKLMDDLY